MDKMVQKMHALLNQTYELSRNVLEELTHQGMQATLKNYSGHYIKINWQYEYQAYPIPVIIVEEVGDIGINLNQIHFEFFVKKEELDEFKVAELLEEGDLEFYGGKECLLDFYSKGDTPKQVMDKIGDSDEAYIGIACYRNKEESIEEIITAFIRMRDLLKK